MPSLILYGDRLSIPVTREFRQLVNISIAAGKFILIHPHYNLIREAMRLDVIEDVQLEEFEVHNWQFELGEVISYDIREVLFFYALLELSCRIFLCDIGDDLKEMALENGDTTEDEFNRVRSFYLKQAGEFLQKMKNSFSGKQEFEILVSKIEQLNQSA